MGDFLSVESHLKMSGGLAALYVAGVRNQRVFGGNEPSHEVINICGAFASTVACLIEAVSVSVCVLGDSY